MPANFDFWQELTKAGLTLIVSTVTLVLGWQFGQRLTYRWNVKQKRREVQLSVSQAFYSAYGEFFAVWKLWNRADRNAPDFEPRGWELHKRAAAAEATVEAMLVKFSTEQPLTSSQIRILGSFRQAFQQLRQAIRNNKLLPWNSSSQPEYVAFKTLACEVATLLNAEWTDNRPVARDASNQLKEITSNEWEHLWFKYGSCE
jgi:hypothetical protein